MGHGEPPARLLQRIPRVPLPPGGHTLRQAWTLAGKEFRDLLRERSVVLALLVQFFVAAFSAFLTVGLVGLYDPDAAEGHPDAVVAYVGPGGFDDYLERAENFRIERPSIEDGVAGFHRGAYAAVVEETFAGNDTQRTVTLLVPESEVQTTLLITQFKSLLRDYERDLRQEREDRIDGSIVYVEGPAEVNIHYGFVFSTLLPLLVLTPVFLAGAVTGDAINQEIQTQTLALLRSSPISTAQLLIGKLLTPVLLVPAQVALWILLLMLNDVPVQNVVLLLAFATILGLLLCAGSVIVAVHVRREGQAQAAYALLVLVFLALALLLPKEPLNVVARLGAGSADSGELIAIAAYGMVALLMLALAILLGRRRLGADES